MAKWGIPGASQHVDLYPQPNKERCPTVAHLETCSVCSGQFWPGSSHVCGFTETAYRTEAPDVKRPEPSVDYAPLYRVLMDAYDQAANGKGKERHANDKPFTEQPIMEIGRMVGMGFNLGQAMKKAQEASRMKPEAAKRELYGAINYIASAILLIEEADGPT